MPRHILAAIALVCAHAATTHASETCRASWYGYESGRVTASGAPDELTAAHLHLPFGTMLRVTYGGRSHRILPMTLLVCLSASLASCMTAGTTTALRDELCAAYGPAITYSGTKDTRATAHQVQAKNATFHKAGCF